MCLLKSCVTFGYLRRLVYMSDKELKALWKKIMMSDREIEALLADIVMWIIGAAILLGVVKVLYFS